MWNKGAYDSFRSTIATDWKLEGQKLTPNVTIALGTTATVHMPAKEGSDMSKSGKLAVDAIGVKRIGYQEGVAVYETESGHYTFYSSL